MSNETASHIPCNSTSTCKPTPTSGATYCGVVIGVLATLLCLAVIAFFVLVIYFKRKTTQIKLQEAKVTSARIQPFSAERQVRVTSPMTDVKIEEPTENYPRNEYDILPKRPEPPNPPTVRQHAPPTPPNVRQHKPPPSPSVRQHAPPTPPNVRKQNEITADDEYLAMDSNVNNGTGDVYENYGIESDDVYGNVQADDIYINN
ncbi:Hypothetical predicted protein [Octopus vulgaris]|uniref:Uncharacterized protein n=1 Tax=Octopus vulgaris TaxID=6645 RepID=A0AA36ASF0_OCTVU|nr:Hypothetical predicted protein [Octopus vulgaris]